MRVRVVQAFSGNNSGSYVIVGTFDDAAVPAALAAELTEVFAAQARWLALASAERAPTSPMHEYAKAQAIETKPTVGAGDDWPLYGGTPTAVASPSQLLVFVDYSVTFPRFVGELFYRRGGRVSVELDHAHEAIVIAHELWLHEGWNRKDEAARAVAGFRTAVESGALDALYATPMGKDPRPPPILGPAFWPGALELIHVPSDVAEGVSVVSALAAAHGLSTRFSLHESLAPGPDPLRGLRAVTSDVGEHQAVLWKPGTDAAAVARVVRSVTGASVAEATELVARAPIEVLVRVSEKAAMDARDALVAAGADAEVLGPQHFRPPR